MENSGFNDDYFISSGQFWKEEDEKTLITSVSFFQEREYDDDGWSGSVWRPRSRKGEKREEGLSKTMMIARPKGGKRYMCMDCEEMKACKELGFELEEDKLKFGFDATMMSSVPSRSASQTSTAASNTSRNISSDVDWHISNPGDDPRDVKARLKLWAHAVAQASSPRRARG